MKDFKKLSKILWMRNKIWITMIIVLFLLTQGISVNSGIKYMEDRILENVISLDWVYENQDKTITQKDIENQYSEIQKKKTELKKELMTGFPEDFFQEYDKKYKELAEKYNFRPDQTYNDWMGDEFHYNYESIETLTKERIYFYNQGINAVLEKSPDGYKMDISQKLFNPSSIVVVIILLGFLLTNSESLTMYYDFTRIFPWSKSKMYFSRILFGLIIVLAAYFGSVAIKYLVWNGSNLKNIVVVNSILALGVPSVLMIIGMFLLVMSIGFVSGNVLGYFGMLLIAFLGSDLWIFNAEGITRLLVGNNSGELWTYRLMVWINELPQFFQVLLKPSNVFNYIGMDNRFVPGFYSLFLLGIIYLILGWYWEKTKKSERSGMLIMKKSVSLYAQFFAVLTSANLMFQLVYSISDIRIISTGIFIVAFALAYLFYKKLFNVRIGI